MKRLRNGRCLAALAGIGLAASAAGAQQAPRRTAFHAIHYDVTATLAPASHQLSARAKVDFQADATSGVVDFELHPNLRITAVTSGDGKAVAFERDAETPLHAKATLPQAVNPGDKVTLTVEYAGTLASDENSPTRGVLLAYVGEDGCFLLQPARWFPLSGYPSGRYTAKFNIIVPDTMAVVGTGKSLPPTIVPDAPPPPPPSAPGKSGAGPARPVPAPPIPAAAAGPKVTRIQYTFVSETPEAAGTFAAGEIQLNPVKAEGLVIPVYVRTSTSATAKAYGEALAKIVNALSDPFGPLANPSITIAQIPEGGISAFAAPGLLLVNTRQWTLRPNERLLARLAAAQWWAYGVTPASASDVWLSDGLARYSEAVYLSEQSEGAAQRALDDFAIGALMYEDAAPIAQAGRLEAYSSEYNSVVANKGAMVFHMLRGQIGDAAFRGLLRDYFAQFNGKSARLEDFQKLAQAAALKASETASSAPAETKGGTSTSKAPLVINTNLTPFFTQWLRSTGVPEFKLQYVVYRTAKGFRTIGKVKQNLDTFRLPVEVKIETLGNPEYRVIDVVGTDSDFSIETFGRPKPGGISLDPNNHLLKASPQLRVRTSIARGEELAEGGKYYEATQQYQAALEVQKNNSLAHFRLGEAAFYQKNYQSAANAFRDALVGDLDLSYKWVEVWSHIYLGKIFDVGGQRERALNEYRRAKDLNDDTGGAQAEADKHIAAPFQEGGKS